MVKNNLKYLIYFSEKMLKLKAKDGKEIPFLFNSSQKMLHESLQEQLQKRGKVRALILKARQVGISSYIAARIIQRISLIRNMKFMLMGHTMDATNGLFMLVKDSLQRLSRINENVKLKGGLRNLTYGNPTSEFFSFTAGGKEVGRSRTAQFFWGSEVAFWQNGDNHIASIFNSISEKDGSEIILESTANGVGGIFYDLVSQALKGENDFEVFFLPWFLHEEYQMTPPKQWQFTKQWRDYASLWKLNDSQLFWAWKKNQFLATSLGEGCIDAPCWRFHQEYPSSINEAFQLSGSDSFIPSQYIWTAINNMTLSGAKKEELDNKYRNNQLIIGVDVARGGRDSSWIIGRRSNILGDEINLRLNISDTMELTNKIREIINMYNPIKVCIDGAGFGSAIYDRLCELGFAKKVVNINFASSPRDKRKYANMRAEIWGEMRDWFKSSNVAVVKDELLMQHISGVRYKFNSSDQIILEPKDEIRKRLGFSPDGGDAAALTFAYKVTDGEYLIKKLEFENYDPFKW